MSRTIRLVLLFLIVVGALAVIGVGGAASSPEIDVLRIEGDIVPAVASYVDRGISYAEENQATAVVIELSTPGGLLSTTERIVDRILAAKVPVVVYVNRWAGSAGTFITLSAHVAAMAPGSRIGAASPVSMGSEEQISDTLSKKITEDTAARIRSLAILRGRNVQAAEATVVEAMSFTDQEALGLAPLSEERQSALGLATPYLTPPLVEIGADSLDALISQLDGRTAKLITGNVTLVTQGYTVKEIGMSGIERFLQAISNPNIAYILLAVGGIGIILELVNPGAILPGVVGAVCLILAFYSLAVLEASWAGVFLIMLGFVLFILEAFITSYGILTLGGIASLVLGALILFGGGPELFRLQVDWWAITLVAVCVAGIFLFMVGAVVRSHRRRPATGKEGLVGKMASARTVLDPGGMVFVEGELWTAISEGGRIEPGEEVVVTRVEGLKLRVAKKEGGG